MRIGGDEAVKSSYVASRGFKGIGQPAEKGGLSVCHGLTSFADGSLRARGRRRRIRGFTDAQGILADGTLGYVDNGRLYYGGNEINGVYLTPGEKNIVRVGRFLTVFPDEAYVDLENTDVCGYMSTSVTLGDESLVTLTDENRTVIETFSLSTALPDEGENGQVCVIRKSSGEYEAYRCLDGKWGIIRPYVKISAPGVGLGFAVGDTVNCVGMPDFVGDHFRIAYGVSDAIYYEGVIPSEFIPRGVTLKRTVPAFDYCTASGGRLYGVRRGFDKDGALVCKVYASAENDPFNFSLYGGGSECSLDACGEITGICAYEGNLAVFTESEIFETRIKGGALIATVTKGYGLEKGAEKSAVSFGGAIYYKSPVGICKYDGSYPERISGVLDRRLYCDGSGSPAYVVNGEYCINIALSETEKAIYVYDIEREAWRTQEGSGAFAYAKLNELVYAMCRDKLILMNGEDAEAAEKELFSDGSAEDSAISPWRLESARISDPALKSMAPVKLKVDVGLASESEMTVGVITGNGNEPSRVVSIPKGTDGVYAVALTPKRTDAVRAVIYGKGDAVIRGYRLEYRGGGEVSLW